MTAQELAEELNATIRRAGAHGYLTDHPLVASLVVDFLIRHAVAAEREALARMIEHREDRWFSAKAVAEAVRRGEKCHPECPLCRLEGRA